MATPHIANGREVFFGDNDIIVSKTDLKGRMTYTNRVFLDIAGYTERECRSEPHSMIRHKTMPRCIFKLMWDTIQAGSEIFAYVVNSCKNGDHYWVYAHVTPSRDRSGEIVGYHSNRRTPDRDILTGEIMPVYEKLLSIENSETNRKQGMNKAYTALQDILKSEGLEYNEYIATIGQRQRRGYR